MMVTMMVTICLWSLPTLRLLLLHPHLQGAAPYVLVLHIPEPLRLLCRPRSLPFHLRRRECNPLRMGRCAG